MISPCYFIDLDTQEAFAGASGIFAANKGSNGIYIDQETFQSNLKLLTKHAVRKGWPIFSPVEVYDEPAGVAGGTPAGRGKKSLLPLPVHCKRGSRDAKKVKETSVRGAFTFAAHSKETKKNPTADYKKLLKKHHQLVFEKYGYDALKNPHFLKAMKAGGIKTCVVYGLALDYGLEALVLRLLKEGLNVFVPVDAVKAINEDNRRMALVELSRFGAKMWNTEFILKNT